MIKINLLREPTVKRRSWSPGISRYNLIALVVAVAVLGLAVAWYWHLTSKKEELTAERERQQRLYASLSQVDQQLQAARQVKERLDQRVALIERLRDNQEGPVRLMNSLLSSMPASPKLWLTSLAQKNRSVTIEGRAFDVPTIADFIADLGRLPHFLNVDLEFWEEQEESIAFKLNCQLGEE